MRNTKQIKKYMALLLAGLLSFQNLSPAMNSFAMQEIVETEAADTEETVSEAETATEIFEESTEDIVSEAAEETGAEETQEPESSDTASEENTAEESSAADETKIDAGAASVAEETDAQEPVGTEAPEQEAVTKDNGTVQAAAADAKAVEKGTKEHVKEETVSALPGKKQDVSIIDTVFESKGDGYTVTVTGKLPEGGTLNVYELEKEDESYKEHLDVFSGKVYEQDEAILPYARFFDITIFDGNKDLWEPAEPLQVKIELDDLSAKQEGVLFHVLHFESDNKTARVKRSVATPSNYRDDEVIEDIDIVAGDEDNKTVTEYIDETEKIEEPVPVIKKAALKFARALKIIPDENQAANEVEPANAAESTQEKTAVNESAVKAETAETSIKADAAKPVELENEEGSNAFMFTASSFSVYGIAYSYTVDFYYEYVTEDEYGEAANACTEYHLPGGASMTLDELFKQLSIDKSADDVSDISFTNEEVLETKQGEDGLTLYSLMPFTTLELMTISFNDGEKIVLTVTDAIGSGTLSGTINWEITDDGVLRIYPKDGVSGRITNTYAQGATGPGSTSWPWKSKAADIVEVKVESGVGTYPNTDLNYMFANCKNLTKADLSGFVQTNPGGSTQADGYTTRNMQGMFLNCESLTSLADITGLDTLQSGRTTDISQMFRGCKGLLKVDGSAEYPLFPLDTSKVENMARLFSECTSLTEADLSNLKNNKKASNMQNMFNGCTGLKRLVFNGTGFESREASGNTLGLAGGLSGMFNGCDSLEYVDMSNLKLHFRNNDSSLQSFIKGNESVETIILSGAVFDGVLDISGAFSGLKSLTYMDLGGNANVFPDAAAMQNLFKDSFLEPQDASKQDVFDNGDTYSLLDITGFGVMDKIVNIDGMFDGCTGLEVLDITGVDIMRIEPKRPQHSASTVDDGAAEANINWSREHKLDTCTGLMWLLAEGSHFWMAKNSAGYAGGSPYFAAQTDEQVYYFTQKQIDYYRTGTETPLVTLETKRDYIDMITDREETTDSGNKNVIYDINRQNNGVPGNKQAGAGLLPQGNFYLHDEWTVQEMPKQMTYYRIDSDRFANSTPVVDINHSNLDYIRGTTAPTIGTAAHSASVWESYDGRPYAYNNGEPVVTITYPAAAMDVNGKVHDIIVYITKISFTGITDIPDPIQTTGSDRHIHEKNTYVEGRSYRRPVIRVDKGTLQLMNYIWTSHDTSTMIKGSSGTEVEFEIQIKDALPDTSVLFFMDDLDIPAVQEYEDGLNVDGVDCWCYDYLPFDNVSYENYSEGIILGDGNDLSTVITAEHSGVAVEGNYIHGTGSDPSAKQDITVGKGSTYWSGFSVKANADKANYTWVSGVGCTTDILLSTPKYDLDPVIIKPEALKTVNGDTPTGQYADMFTFQLVKAAGIEEVEYDLVWNEDYLTNANESHTQRLLLPNSAVTTAPVQNNGSLIKLNDLEFAAPSASQADPFYSVHPASADESAYGEYNAAAYNYNEHEARAYVYRLMEIEGAETSVLSYNTTHVTYFMKVIVSGPENDLEMNRGAKAEITIGRYVGTEDDGVSLSIADTLTEDQIDWDDYTYTVWSNDSDTATVPTGKRRQETMTVPYNGTYYTVREDKDGVKYFEIPLGNDEYEYRSPDTKDILLQTKIGNVYPYDAQDIKKQIEMGHDDKRVPKQLYIDGQPVKCSVDGQHYVKIAGKYYAVDIDAEVKGAEIVVKDGVFNPDDASDRNAYVYDKIDGNVVRICSLTGMEYYKSGSSYYGRSGNLLVAGELGDVFPQENDRVLTRDHVDENILYITHGDGESYPVKTAADGSYKYYRAKDGRYYSVMGTLMEGFTPAATDIDYKLMFDIYQDYEGDDAVLYYQSHGRYYTLDGTLYEPAEIGVTDRRKIMLGTFNNRIKTSDMSVTKKSVDGNGVENEKDGLFTYRLGFSDGFRVKDFEFEPAAPDSFLAWTGSDYTVKLHPGQTLHIYNIPFNTGYVVTEQLENNGWELVSASEWNAADELQQDCSKRVITGLIDVERILRADTTIGGISYSAGEPNPLYKGQNDHVYKNRFTEMLLKKVVKTGNRNEGFGFSAVVTNIPQSAVDEGFSYGWMDGAGNKNFSIAQPGTASVTITTDPVKHGKDTVLVFPYGASVEITETNGAYDASWKWEDADGTLLEKGNESGGDPFYTHPETATAALTANKETAPAGIGDKTAVTFINEGTKDLTVIKQTGPVKDGEYPTGTFTYEMTVNRPANLTLSKGVATPSNYVPYGQTDVSTGVVNVGTETLSVEFKQEDETAYHVVFNKGSAITDDIPTVEWAVSIDNIKSFGRTAVIDTVDHATNAARVRMSDGEILTVPLPDALGGGEYGILAGRELTSEYPSKWTFTIDDIDSVTGLNNPNGTPAHLVIKNIPIGTFYTITELPQNGWRLVAAEHTYENVINVTEPLPDAYFENEHAYNLTVRKNARGADSSDEFKFTAIFSEKDGMNNIPYDIDSSNVVTSGGAAAVKKTTGIYEITLKDFALTGSQVVFSGLPVGVSYDISEDAKTGWHQASAENAAGTITDTDITSTFTNIKKLALEFEKEVKGNQGSRDKYFAFTVTVNGLPAGYEVGADLTNADAVIEAPTEATTVITGRTEQPTKLTANAEGVATGSFYLQHGQSVRLTDVLCGTGYTVSENKEDYKASTKVIGDNEDAAPGDIAEGDADTVSDRSLNLDTNVTFTNRRGGIIPTGADAPWIPYVLIAMIGLFGTAFGFVRRKKKI